MIDSQIDGDVGWMTDNLLMDLWTFIDWCFDPSHKVVKEKDLKSIEKDIKLKITFFFACKEIILLYIHRFNEKTRPAF